ncbi:class I SAM-dependent methyltransferase [Paraoerskovia sediminicola]|uniref:class I SAM-dependent methyltransferase n=1 Tax=Paraoerskovia sediminicola TaxID=1138587 RepID=UPI0025739105|nr:class I SAM-dependent methyltransferase [Paraoerskovia sediminicola]
MTSTLGSAGYSAVPDDVGGAAARGWWDENAPEYQREHDGFLKDELVWGPEGLRESDAGLLGPVAGLDVLEIGAGAAQCARWLAAQGARVVATDVSIRMLLAGDTPGPAGVEGAACAGPGRSRGRAVADRARPVPLVQADARALPFAAASFDTVFTAYGAVPFVPDARRIHSEVARVLRPGGTWAFSVTHPVRWAFPDDPGEKGLTVHRSYFDRRPYVESDGAGRVTYAEYHRTVGDHVRDVVSAGLQVVDVVEPEWPESNQQVWGGWGPVRGRLIPGTMVVVARRPG